MSFDLVAPYYRTLETIAFGNALHRARIQWLGQIPRPNRTLIIGEGNGRFLCDFLHVHPGIDVDCIDVSNRMLQLAAARVRNTHPESSANVRFLQQDILQWIPHDCYDLLVTHFFLDCFRIEQLRSIVEKLAGAAARSMTTWLLTDFTIPHTGLARIHAKLWLQAMYFFFRVTARIKANELVDPEPLMIGAGFEPVAIKLTRWQMLRAGVYSNAPGAAKIMPPTPQLPS